MQNEQAPLHWGIISTAKIGRTKVIPALLRANGVTLAGVASRGAGRAAEFLEQEGWTATAYDSYEAMFEDERIDVVYNPTPNHLHVPLTLKAMAAGKHVLCEKPLALSADEAKQLAEAAAANPGIKVMEAFMYRFHAQWQEVKRLVDSGRLGALTHIHSRFAYTNMDADNVRNKADIGGGALMDIGCYCISLSRWLTGEEPEWMSAQQHIDPAFGTDSHTAALMHFPSDVSASFYCSTQSAPEQSVEIQCQRGKIRMDLPFTPEWNAPVTIKVVEEGVERDLVIEAHDQYRAQIEAFSAAVAKDTVVPTPLSDAVNNMRVIESLRETAYITPR